MTTRGTQWRGWGVGAAAAVGLAIVLAVSGIVALQSPSAPAGVHPKARETGPAAPEVPVSEGSERLIERQTAPVTSARTLAARIRVLEVDRRPLAPGLGLSLKADPGALLGFERGGADREARSWIENPRVASALLDAEGIAELEVDEPGRYIAQIDHAHYSLVDSPALLISSSETNEYTLFVRHGGSVRGRILRPDGSPVEGALVGTWVHDDFFGLDKARGPIPSIDSPANLRLTQTDEAGDFEVGGLLPGEVRLAIGGAGIPPTETDPARVRAGETVELADVVLGRGAALRLHVHDAAALHEGLVVRVVPRQRSMFLTEHEVSVRESPFMLQVPGGHFDLRVDAGAHGTAMIPGVSVDDGGVEDVNVELDGRLTTVSGTVLDIDGQALQDVSVSVIVSGFERRAVTGPSGEFQLRHVPAGQATFSALASGYRPLTTDRQIRPELSLELVLEFAGAVAGKVFGAPQLTDAIRVLLVPDDGRAPRGPIAVEGGQFRFANVPDGSYSVVAVSDAGIGVRRGVRLTSSSREVEVSISLEEPLVLRGQVKDATTSRPIAGVAVAVSPLDLPRATLAESVTSIDGRFTTLSTPGASIKLSRPGYVEELVTAPLIDAGAELAVQMTPSGLLEVLVREDGGAAAGVTVSVTDQDAGDGSSSFSPAWVLDVMGGGSSLRGVTDEDGIARFQGIAPGQYTVLGQRGTRRGSSVAQVQGGITRAELDLGPLADHSLEGVVMRDSSPMPDVRIVLLAGSGVSSGRLAEVLSDEHGAFEFQGLQSGTHELRLHWAKGQTREIVDVNGRTQVVITVASAVLEVVLRAAADGEVLIGVPVQITGADGHRAVKSTNSEGVARFDGISADRYNVSGPAKGYTRSQYVTEHEVVTVGAEGIERITLFVREGHSLRAALAGGEQGRQVLVLEGPLGAAAERHVAVIRDDVIELHGLEPGRYALALHGPSGERFEVDPHEVEIPYSGILEIRIPD